jgi:hypothetical protein
VGLRIYIDESARRQSIKWMLLSSWHIVPAAFLAGNSRSFELLKLRNAIAHGLPDPSFIQLAEIYSKKVAVYLANRVDSCQGSRAAAANSKALTRTLLKVRVEVTRRLRLWNTARIPISSLIRRILRGQIPKVSLIPTLHRQWLRVHGPRPPRQVLMRLVSCFQQVNGRVHSPLTA